jgi:competence protein ComEC
MTVATIKGGASSPRAREAGAELARLAGDASARMRVWAKAESGRLELWAPVAIGGGAAFYFALRVEPPFWLAPLCCALSLAVCAKFMRIRPIALATTLILLGFFAADWRAARVDAPMLARELNPTDIVGRLLAVDEGPSQRRLIVAPQSIAGVKQEELPARLRITWRGKGFDVGPGDLIALRAGLLPPPEPALPGGFDYARQLYFQKIGATGYAVTPPQAVAEGEPRRIDRARAAIERARIALAARILEAAPGDGGAFVAASITGKREGISQAAEAALRDSGLAHLVAISGLNMALATGIIFFALRLALAAIEPLALRFPIKKWAAGAALLSGVGYLLISGGGWSAQRAFIMTSIFFVAILFDRRALSLRNVAIAATVILLLTPEAVIHPGFQMSFAAVTALIASYEWYVQRQDPDRSFSWPARASRYLAGVAATDVIASTATAPFGLFHFNRAAVFGLPANVVAVPVMGFWVMPAAILALALAPFGLDAMAWRLAAAGADLIFWMGETVAGWPGAVATFHKWPIAALILLTLGGLWLCLMTAPWRLAGPAAVPAAFLIAVSVRPPDLILSADGDNVGVLRETSTSRDAAGSDGGLRLAMLRPHKDKFLAGVWKEHAGIDADRSPTAPLSDIGRCDPAGCTAQLRGRAVAISSDPLGLAEDCARARVVAATYPVTRRNRQRCERWGATLIDRRDAWDGGAHAVWIGADGSLKVRTVQASRGARPWTVGSRLER